MDFDPVPEPLKKLHSLELELVKFQKQLEQHWPDGAGQLQNLIRDLRIAAQESRDLHIQTIEKDTQLKKQRAKKPVVGQRS